MTWEAIVFWILAALVVVPALGIVLSRNIVHMAFWLLGTLLGVAGLYILMGADFLGLTQVTVYIGGINVLLLFGIMLTNREPVFLRNLKRRPALTPALILGALLLLGLTKAITSTEWHKEAGAELPGVRTGVEATTGLSAAGQDGTAATIGTWLLSEYILPFEIVSVLLLVVLVGAAYIARREPEDRGAASHG